MADQAEMVSLTAGTGMLQGMLERPAARAAGLAVLILAGSGPTDRDGNQPGMVNNSLKLLAAGLRQRGIITLRIDKRGIGASVAAATDEAAMRIETYVDDAIAWLGFLQRQPGIRHVALVGHSEGALIATLAAQRFGVSALALIAGAGQPIGAVLRAQLDGHLSPDWQQRAFAILAALEAGRLVADVPPELAALFRPSVQPYMISWLAYDPATELAKIKVPVLILQGRRDLQSTEAGARRLAAANSAAELQLYDDMNHILKAVPDDRAANLASYNDPALPLAPGLVARLAAFLLKASPR